MFAVWSIFVLGEPMRRNGEDYIGGSGGKLRADPSYFSYFLDLKTIIWIYSFPSQLTTITMVLNSLIYWMDNLHFTFSCWICFMALNMFYSCFVNCSVGQFLLSHISLIPYISYPIYLLSHISHIINLHHDVLNLPLSRWEVEPIVARSPINFPPFIK